MVKIGSLVKPASSLGNFTFKRTYSQVKNIAGIFTLFYGSLCKLLKQK